MKYFEIKELSKQLRNNPTVEEKILLQRLRQRSLSGFKFLRQYPIIYESRNVEYFFYIPDFYCATKKVVIELNGKIHNLQKNRDAHREEILAALHLNILRIKNEEFENIDQVIKKIKKFIKSVPYVSELYTGRGRE